MFEHFALELPDGVRAQTFRPGDELRGHVTLTVSKPLRAQRLRLQLVAEETTHFRETRRGSPLSLTTKERQAFITVGALVWGMLEDTSSKVWDTIPPGTHRFGFTLTFPEVNYPPSLDRPNVCRVHYALRASLERPGKLVPYEFTPAIDLQFAPVYEGPAERIHTVITETVHDPEQGVAMAFTGTVTTGTVVPGEINSAAVQVESRCDMPIRRVTCELVERIECLATIRGQDRAAIYELPIKAYDATPPVAAGEKAALARALAGPTPDAPTRVRHAHFLLPVPYELSPTRSRQLIIDYQLLFTVEFTGLRGLAYKRLQVTTPIRVVHRRAGVGHPVVTLPYHFESGAALAFDVALRTEFQPWDPTNPHWPRKSGMAPPAVGNPAHVPDVSSPPWPHAAGSSNGKGRGNFFKRLVASHHRADLTSPSASGPALPPRRASIPGFIPPLPPRNPPRV
ncbi:hypothetical protein IWQ60_008184 [Tieghemiomyces parasiticus]|uniref:Arrestin-like N-terminal domain-containing protein n=1 Tax=Tieghemiomyces parasiticus TaxID=78921 RepID=A0A9W8DNL4_9FUNG|nr:hypothetical protein IWQ60_008184 [Tieghemiomyces parasiticus]